MRQIVRNYIKKEQDQTKKTSMSHFTTIEAMPFINYMVKVMSIFDDKNYQYKTLNVKDEKNILTPQITVCIIYNASSINKEYLNDINTSGLLEYVYINTKNKKDFIYFEIKDKMIPLLDQDLNINFTSLFLNKFSYISNIIYDLIAHKYEQAASNHEIDYNYLESNITNEYKNQIANRRVQLQEENQNLTKQEKQLDDEINMIIDFVSSREALDEVTKKMIIYDVKKNIKKYN